MRKIKIVNTKTNQEYEAIFDNQSELDAWKTEQVKNDSWGKKEREVAAFEATQEMIDESISSRVVTDELSQQEITYYTLPKEYTITESNYSIDYVTKRIQEYSKIDSLLKEALVEKELGDDTKWNEYIALREAIKTAHPKV